MGRMSDLDLSIKEDFVTEFTKLARKRRWDDRSGMLEDALEEIFNKDVNNKSVLKSFIKDVWFSCDSNDPLETIIDVANVAWNRACERNRYFQLANIF